MFNLVQFLEKRGLSSGVQPIKEKITADKIQGIKPVEQLGKVPEVKSIDEPVKSLTSSITDKPLKKVAYARNTGVRDASNNVYINREDVSLLAKLGYSVNRDEYLFLPLGESKEDLYSYIEKMAGVSKSVSRSVDRGEAFSGEYLKDMGYEVPEGYEVKGDLVCPVEKKADINNTPNNQATVADPYSGIAGDAAVNAGEAAAIYGANKLSKNFKERIFTKADKFPGVGPLLQKANLWKNVAKYIPVGGAAAQAYGAVDRFKNKDYIGSAIDGVGAVGSVAQILPNPVAKGVGLGVSTASTAVNAARDIHKYNNRPVEFRTTPPQLPTQPATAPNNTPISQPSQLAKQGEATHELKSSNIRAVGYDKENKRLEVAFHSGGNYTYNDVPKSLFDRIRKVKSPGKFFHKHIKKDNPYGYERIEKEASKQPLLPAIKQWLKKQPFNHAEDAFKHGRIPKHVRDDVVSGRAAEKYRPKFKEMLDHLRNSGQI